ncbi:MAG: WhiB family transcriptional regulator [Actinobacteria bacterium]|nr:MAG: WhiB family transcriptional regulator [Actinomycetota bacterium]
MNTMDDTLEFNIFDVPILHERPWAVFAACKDEQGMAFFPQTRDEEVQALTICGIWPVSEDGLDYALETKERFGVWGGTTEKERRRLSRIA